MTNNNDLIGKVFKDNNTYYKIYSYDDKSMEFECYGIEFLNKIGDIIDCVEYFSIYDIVDKKFITKEEMLNLIKSDIEEYINKYFEF